MEEGYWGRIVRCDFRGIRTFRVVGRYVYLFDYGYNFTGVNLSKIFEIEH